jgi:hypothetical protein
MHVHVPVEGGRIALAVLIIEALALASESKRIKRFSAPDSRHAQA